jgi:hypothetical protein
VERDASHRKETHGMTSADRIVTLFLHIPKCAGTTLGNLIYPNYADSTAEVSEDGLFHGGLYYFPGDGFFKPADLHFDDEIARVMQRPDLKAVIGHFWYGLHRLIPRECEYVTVLRDPAQRLWSLYNHLEYGRWTTGFEEFLHTGPWRELDNDQTRRIAGIEPATGDCDARVFDAAVAHLRRFAVVGTVERFDLSVAVMARELRWQTPVVYYPLNVITGNDTEPVDTNGRDLVADMIPWDVRLYSIADELLSERLDKWGAAVDDDLAQLRSRKDEWRKAGHVIPD